MHPDFDQKPSKNKFDRFPVAAYRLESGAEGKDFFFVFEMDLVNDELGPRTPPIGVSENQARVRLSALGLTLEEVDARIAHARKWMATLIVPPGTPPEKLGRPPL